MSHAFGVYDALFFASVTAMICVAASPARAVYAARVGRYTGGGGEPSAERGREAWRLPRALEIFLARAGADWSPAKALGILVLHLLGGLVLGKLLGVPLFGLILGPLVLYMRLRIAQTRRLRKLGSQLPEALMLMASAIRSGLGFQQSLKLVSEQGAQPIAGEMLRFSQDLAMGLTMAESLARLQARFGSTDAEMLASALLIQHQTGGNLTEILLNLHQTIRERQQVEGQVRSLTAQGRLSGIILTGLPVILAVAFYFLNRTYLMVLINDPRGRMLLGFGIVSTLIGAFTIRRLVDIRL